MQKINYIVTVMGDYPCDGRHPLTVKTNMVDLNDELIRSVVTVDDGRDYTARLIWKMGSRRNMRNGASMPMPPAPQVSVVRVEAKMKPRKRGYRVVQKAIGTM